MMRLVCLAVALAVMGPGAAMAQAASTASVVSGCGTPNITYNKGDVKPLTMDTTGKLCDGGGGGGSVYPAGATPITASATGTTGATTATLAANATLHTYICGFSIRANATAATTADSSVSGTVTGTMHYTQWTAPNASGIGLTEEIFSPCIISSAVNTGIAVISAAPGTGGVVSVTAWGFQF